MGWTKPDQPEFEIDDWRKLPYTERLRLMCVTWCTQGFGAPDAVYVLYVTKIACYVGMFFVFAAVTPSLGGPAVVRRVVVGAGGVPEGDPLDDAVRGHGPRLWQRPAHRPLRADVPGLAALAPRPGTTRLRPFAWVPFTGGSSAQLVRRCALRRAVGPAAAGRCCRVDASARSELAPDHRRAVPPRPSGQDDLPGGAVRALPDDRRSSSCSRADLIAGAKAVQVILWLGAATSKLNHHFPNVMAIMQSQQPDPAVQAGASGAVPPLPRRPAPVAARRDDGPRRRPPSSTRSRSAWRSPAAARCHTRRPSW